MEESTERRFTIWWGCLVGLTCALTVGGIAFAVLAEPLRVLLESLLYVPLTGERLRGAAAGYVALHQAVMGAVIAGWSAALLSLLFGPFRRRERWAWVAIAASLAVWFVLDTTYSALSHYTLNALLNAVTLALFALPLAGTYSYFQAPASRSQAC
jgi:hypothetical protein